MVGIGIKPAAGRRREIGDAWGTPRSAVMNAVSLPNGPDESLKQTVRLLSSWIAPPDYRLGGGTALAAIWGHRHSTDIDLAANAHIFEDRIERNFEEIHRELQAERGRGSWTMRKRAASEAGDFDG